MSAYMKATAVARIFGVTSPTIRKWAARGLLAHVRLPNGDYRFRPEDVDEFIRRHKGDVSHGTDGDHG